MLVETEEAYKELPGYCDNPNCFYCGESISLPMIVWSSSNAYIQFHPDCAATFLLAFARDLHAFKQSSGKVLTFDTYVSPEAKLQAHKEAMAYIAELKAPAKIPQYNVQLAVPDFQFIDGGSEKAHIQKKGWKQTRCGHYFKQVRIMEARELDSYDVCHHCCKQGGVRTYNTGRWIEWDDTERVVRGPVERDDN